MPGFDSGTSSSDSDGGTSSDSSSSEDDVPLSSLVRKTPKQNGLPPKPRPSVRPPTSNRPPPRQQLRRPAPKQPLDKKRKSNSSSPSYSSGGSSRSSFSSSRPVPPKGSSSRREKRKRPVAPGSDSSSDDEFLSVAVLKKKKPQAVGPAQKRNLIFTKSPDSKRTRLVITRKEEPKRVEKKVVPMSDFITDSPWNSDESDDDDGEEGSSSGDMRDESDSDAPLSRLKGKSRASRKSKATGKKKKSVPGRLTRTKPAQSTKQDVPIYEADSYEVIEELVPLQSAEAAVKWWDREPYKGDQKWSTLRHNGVLFPPPYEPHGVKLHYKGKPVTLSTSQEETATFFAVLIESDHAKNPVFRKNFFEDWKKDLGHDHEIQDLDNVDFRPIYDWYQTERERKKEQKKIPAVKAKLKKGKESEKQIYGFAVVDDVRQQVGNYMVELPGLFRGRGKHPKTGKVKRRLYPEDVFLNIGEGEKIPKPPIEGHKWGGVMHNNTVTYIARWKDPIQGTLKPVYLHASSRFKGENDRKKYEIARKLKKHIKRIRESYKKELNSSNLAIRQRATALWIIDVLSIRVGNEKDTSETADTVGVCTLRVEHITFVGNHQITFDFLGKDSMRYFNTVTVIPDIYDNLQRFCRRKKPDNVMFDLLTPSGVNEYLSDLMPGLTAKCFRTHNASVCLQNELGKSATDGEDRFIVTSEDTEYKKKHFYDLANRQVAILCNHQKTVSKNYDEQMKKASQKLQDAEDKLLDLEDELCEALGKKRKRVKKDDKKDVKKRKRSAEAVQVAYDRQKARIDKMKMDNKLKSENKEIALGTSKINYMDPRITVAWCKKLEFPIEKVFQRALLDKFPWAMAAPTGFGF